MGTMVAIDSLLLSSRKRVDTRFEKFKEEVMLANNRVAALTSNEVAFLFNRFKEGKKSEDVLI